jgi:hypothetical protein
MPKSEFRCHICNEEDPDKFVGEKHRCIDCSEIMEAARFEGLLNTIADPIRMVREKRILNGQPRRADHPSFRCVADPQEGFLGSFFFGGIMDKNIEAGVMPSGSLWVNDHDSKVYEVMGALGEPQELLPVGKERIKLLEARFPRLRRALCNPGVY